MRRHLSLFEIGSFLVCALFVLLPAAITWAEASEEDSTEIEADSAANEDDSPVAAEVNGYEIHVADLERAMDTAVGGRQLTPQIKASIAASTLDQLINQRLVESSLLASGKKVEPEQVDEAIAKTVPKLGNKSITLEEFLAKGNMTLETLRKKVAWQILWNRTLHELLTDEVLEKYYQEHHQEYDGSQVRASHILLRPQKAGDPLALEALLTQAAALREKIKSGKMTFADAAAKYSAGPSRASGGDVGFFPRNEVMAEAFAEAAFKLKKDDISNPVTTQFGIHLIMVTDIKSGEEEVKWQQFREKLAPLASSEMFENMAKRERAKAHITFTDLWPYFDPRTHQLVMPKQAD